MRDITPDNQQIYDQNWDSWRDMKIYGPASRWLRGLVSELLDLAERGNAIRTVLDVGCGEGTNTALIAQRIKTASVKGIDFSKLGIDCAKATYRFPNLLFHCDLSAESLNEHYDLITCLEVLEHVEDWQDLLDRITNASKKYVLLSFPTGRMRPFEVNVGHLRNFKKGEAEAFLETRNFLPVRTYYAGFPFYSPFYRDVCNITDAASNSFTKGKYGVKQKVLSSVAYFCFRYLSTKHVAGDQFCGLFARKELH